MPRQPPTSSRSLSPRGGPSAKGASSARIRLGRWRRRSARATSDSAPFSTPARNRQGLPVDDGKKPRPGKLLYEPLQNGDARPQAFCRAHELTQAIANLESAEPCLIMIGRAIDPRSATGSPHDLPRNQQVNWERKTPNDWCRRLSTADDCKNLRDRDGPDLGLEVSAPRGAISL